VKYKFVLSNKKMNVRESVRKRVLLAFLSMNFSLLI